jgi:hypothetical protein
MNHREETTHVILAILAAVLYGLYSPNLIPQLPTTVRVFFQNDIVRFVVISLIAYLGNHNITLSLVLAVFITLIVSYIHHYHTKQHLSKTIHKDFYHL